MSRQWEGTVLLSHESFGGYTQRDGSVNLYVVASDAEEAKKKLATKAKQLYRGYDRRLCAVRRMDEFHGLPGIGS